MRGLAVRIYAECSGFAATNEAHHMSTPEPSGTTLRAAITQALDEANLRGDQLDYVNPHASGTQANDVNELRHLHAVIGDALASIPVSGTSRLPGIASELPVLWEWRLPLLALEHQWIPPTPNLDEPDPVCTIADVVAIKGRPHSLRYVLSNSLGFGGINTALVLGKVSDVDAG